MHCSACIVIISYHKQPLTFSVAEFRENTSMSRWDCVSRLPLESIHIGYWPYTEVMIVFVKTFFAILTIHTVIWIISVILIEIPLHSIFDFWSIYHKNARFNSIVLWWFQMRRSVVWRASLQSTTLRCLQCTTLAASPSTRCPSIRQPVSTEYRSVHIARELFRVATQMFEVFSLIRSNIKSSNTLAT